MNKDVFAATLGLDETVALGRIELFHGTCGPSTPRFNVMPVCVRRTDSNSLPSWSFDRSTCTRCCAGQTPSVSRNRERLIRLRQS